MSMILRLPDDLDDTLGAQSEIEDRSMQAIAEDAIREYIDRRSFLLEFDELNVLIPRRKQPGGPCCEP